jgi:hypothetical protein
VIPSESDRSLIKGRTGVETSGVHGTHIDPERLRDELLVDSS